MFTSAINRLVRHTVRVLPVGTCNTLNRRNYTKLYCCRILQGNAKLIATIPSITHTRNGGSFYMPYTLKYIEERVLLVLKLYDKVNPETISLNSHFMQDVGLDSLDHVEVIIAMEDEFDFEIPEEHHHRLMRPKDIVRYVADRFDIYE